MGERFDALFISDIHMSNALPHAKPGPKGVTDRLAQQVQLWEHVGKTAVKTGSEAVFILGDLFDKANVDPVTLTQTVGAISKLPCQVYILAGNHDAADTKSGGRFNVEAFGEMKNPNIHYMGVNDAFEAEDWLRFYPVPFGPAEWSMTQIEHARVEAKANPDIMHVLLLHHSIVGCSHLGWTCDDGLDGEKVVKDFSCVFSGHFHEHQHFGDEERGPCFYLGAPMHHHFGDAGRAASYWHVTFSDDMCVDVKPVDPGLPKFHVINTDIHEFTPDVPEGVAPGDYLRVEIRATHSEWKGRAPKASEFGETGVNIDLKHKPVATHKARISKPKAEGKLTMRDYVSEYTKRAESPGLNPKKLLKLGYELLEEAEHNAA